MIALLLLLAAPPEAFSGRVVGVMDGDTIEVMHDGRAERVRLSCIDAPEKGQPAATLAKQFMSSVAFGKTVTVRAVGTDRFGRTVGEVQLEDGDSLNQKLLRTGLAWRYQPGARCGTPELLALEAQARQARVGLWAHQPQVAPWVFRKDPVEIAAAAPSPTPAPAGPRRLTITNADLPATARGAELGTGTFLNGYGSGTSGGGGSGASGHRPGTDVHVRAHTRKDGTYVPAHTRAAPGRGSSSSGRGSSKR